jgi:cyclic pyranopterin phosphate synthase
MPDDIPQATLTHIDEKGQACMVDVTAKSPTHREAVARGAVRVKRETLSLIEDGRMPKGDVYAVARIAGIMAAKNTSGLIPMCHPLEITGVDITFESDRERSQINIESRVRTWSRTGVEMEALTAVGCAALTIYDMCKAVDKAMVVTDIRLISKKGGKSGPYRRQEP